MLRHARRSGILALLTLFAVGCAGTQMALQPTVTPPPPANVHTIVVEREHRNGYNRRQWHHWIDADHDCQDTRQEVLLRDGSDIKLDRRGCRVKSGLWQDPYTGKTLNSPHRIDIDHMVPLQEAYDSGAWRWNAYEREQYANDLQDPHHLLAVSAGANRSKGARSPDEWMPPNQAWVCSYIADWVHIKTRWHLSMDLREFRFVANRYKSCGLGTLRAANGPFPETPELFPREKATSQRPTQKPLTEGTAQPGTCCRRCNPARSKPCGNSCISLNKTCHKESGCACSRSDPRN